LEVAYFEAFDVIYALDEGTDPTEAQQNAANNAE
jgi:hypothetical protein